MFSVLRMIILNFLNMHQISDMFLRLSFLAFLWGVSSLLLFTLSGLQGYETVRKKSSSIPKATRKSKDKGSEKTGKEKSSKEGGLLASQLEFQVRTKPKTGFVECATIVLSVGRYFQVSRSVLLAALVYPWRFSVPCFATFLALHLRERLNYACNRYTSCI